MAIAKIAVKADVSEIENLIDQLKDLQTYKLHEGAEQTLVDLDDVVKIFADHVEAEVAQPEPQWIPCSERLPSEGIEVVLTDTGWNMVIGRLVRTDEGYKWDVGAWWNDLEDWTAWMQLPEPWEGEQP